jgi:hypothetical protein
MSQALAANFDGAQQQSNSKASTYATLAVLAVITALFSTMAFAGGGGGTEFNAIYTAIEGWVGGVPGKIIAILAFSAAMFNVVKQNFMMAAGAFLGAVVMANAVTVIDLLFGAGIPVA